MSANCALEEKLISIIYKEHPRLNDGEAHSLIHK